MTNPNELQEDQPNQEAMNNQNQNDENEKPEIPNLNHQIPIQNLSISEPET